MGRTPSGDRPADIAQIAFRTEARSKSRCQRRAVVAVIIGEVVHRRIDEAVKTLAQPARHHVPVRSGVVVKARTSTLGSQIHASVCLSVAEARRVGGIGQHNRMRRFIRCVGGIRPVREPAGIAALYHIVCAVMRVQQSVRAGSDIEGGLC
jgi:hypothetical protein